MSDRWNLLITRETDPIFNMAVEDAIASRVGERTLPPTLRFWKDRSCFVVGRFGRRRFVEQIKRVEKEGFLVVERQSGGEAIYHDEGCVNFSVFVPRPYDGQNWDRVEEAFKHLSTGLIRGLKYLSIPCVQSRVETFCPGPYDLAVNGKKIAGLSMARRKRFVLLQGTLVVNSDLNHYFDMLTKFYGELERDKITSLKEEIGKEVKDIELIEAIVKGYEEAFHVRFNFKTQRSYPERSIDNHSDHVS